MEKIIVNGMMTHWHFESWVVPRGFTAITFGTHVYTKLTANQLTDKLILHEAEHVKQYASHGGVAKFLSAYIWNWFSNGLSYRDNKLEDLAYEAERQRGYTIVRDAP
jgi:hypothetical protein